MHVARNSNAARTSELSKPCHLAKNEKTKINKSKDRTKLIS